MKSRYKGLLFLAIGILLLTGRLEAQKYFTRDAYLSFYSEAPVETIEAHTNTGTSVFDSESGQIEFAVLIKSFQFKKALMQEHFNENYMESGTYPKAKFKGKVENVDEINLSKDGQYPVEVSGDLTIHGVTNSIDVDGTFYVENGNIRAESVFKVKVADYDIKIPAVVRDNIAREIEITVKANYQELNR